MIVTEIITRLTDRCGSSFALIEGAVALAAVSDAPPATPAAYVVPMREASGENERMTGGLLQRTELDIAVVIIVENVSDDRGAAAGQDLEPLKAAVRAALLGWMPASAEDVITHVSGELTASREGVVWWEEIFATAAYLESNGAD